jgi:hypothetical protein
MNLDYSYLVGALENENLTPQIEQEKINECAAHGWILFCVLVKKIKSEEYTVFYFRRVGANDPQKPNPRFDMVFSN